MYRILFSIVFLLAFGTANAYRISGTLKISDEWQPRIFMASINSPENLFVASPEFMINQAMVAPDGTFVLEGQDLPDEPRFYRLYLVRNNLFALEFTADSTRNFMHLLLNNSTQLTISNHSAEFLFDKIQVEGSSENTAMNDFESRYFQKRRALNAINTVAKRDFQSQSLNRSIREYVEKSANPMVGLFALYHIENRETDFLRNANFYFDFQDRLKNAYPKALYTNVYNEMLANLVGYRDLVCEIPKITKPWRTWIIWVQALVIAGLAFWIWQMKRKAADSADETDYTRLLTGKERRIWEGLAAGKTNKEIASELFIELSTVKTHINNLYKRLGVANRKDAIALYNQLNSNSNAGV